MIRRWVLRVGANTVPRCEMALKVLSSEIMFTLEVRSTDSVVKLVSSFDLLRFMVKAVTAVYFDAGVRALRHAAENADIFCYMLFKALGSQPQCR